MLRCTMAGNANVIFYTSPTICPPCAVTVAGNAICHRLRRCPPRRAQGPCGLAPSAAAGSALLRPPYALAGNAECLHHRKTVAARGLPIRWPPQPQGGGRVED